MGKSVVVFPTSRPSWMASPLTPGPASQPRVAAKGGGEGGFAGAPAAGGGAGGAEGGGPSNRHSVRGGGAAGVAALPVTCFASKTSTRRVTAGAGAAAGRVHALNARAPSVRKSLL